MLEGNGKTDSIPIKPGDMDYGPEESRHEGIPFNGELIRRADYREVEVANPGVFNRRNNFLLICQSNF